MSRTKKIAIGLPLRVGFRYLHFYPRPFSLIITPIVVVVLVLDWLVMEWKEKYWIRARWKWNLWSSKNNRRIWDV